MQRLARLLIIVGIGIFAGVLAIVLGNQYITSFTDFAAKATVAASVITLYGVIFTAIYGEISTYYKERKENISKKWETVLPFIKEHYNPWIGAAQSLDSALKQINPQNVTEDNATRILFLTTVFFGRRLRFIIKDGGLLLLSSNTEEDKVMKSYREIERNFRWAGDETPKYTSYLQKLFIQKDKVDAPLVWWIFSEELDKDKTLQICRDELKKWLTKQNITTLDEKVAGFIECFKSSINKLYTAWSD